jgi:hypothetical protein
MSSGQNQLLPSPILQTPGRPYRSAVTMYCVASLCSSSFIPFLIGFRMEDYRLPTNFHVGCERNKALSSRNH